MVTKGRSRKTMPKSKKYTKKRIEQDDDNDSDNQSIQFNDITDSSINSTAKKQSKYIPQILTQSRRTIPSKNNPSNDDFNSNPNSNIDDTEFDDSRDSDLFKVGGSTTSTLPSTLSNKNSKTPFHSSNSQSNQRNVQVAQSITSASSSLPPIKKQDFLKTTKSTNQEKEKLKKESQSQSSFPNSVEMDSLNSSLPPPHPTSSFIHSNPSSIPIFNGEGGRMGMGIGGGRVEELRRNYEKLNNLKVTQSEQLLQDFKEKLAVKDKASDRLIISLKKENELLKSKLEQFSLQSSSSSSQSNNMGNNEISINGGTSRSIIPSLQSLSNIPLNSSLNLNNLLDHPLLNLYSKLSGLSITPLSNNEWNCDISGRLGSYSFTLKFDDGEYLYIPRSNPKDNKEVWERLPAYLKEEIAFDTDQIQLFFWRALNFLMTK